MSETNTIPETLSLSLDSDERSDLIGAAGFAQSIMGPEPGVESAVQKLEAATDDSVVELSLYEGARLGQSLDFMASFSGLGDNLRRVAQKLLDAVQPIIDEFGMDALNEATNRQWREVTGEAA